MPPIVECVKVNKIFEQGDSQVHAVHDVSLAIQPGEFVSLSGPSGCGKTTLLHTISGLLPVTSGQITVDSERVDELDKAALADLRLQKIGFVFQAFNLVPVLSARENVEFILQLLGVAKSERRARANEALERVGLPDAADRRPAKLSGGQQQRVALARAIVSRPALLIADEPSANLDTENTRKLIELLADINETQSTTVLVASHDPMVIEFAKRRVRLRDGEVRADERDERPSA